MKRFKFSLQTVHDLRAAQRDEAEIELTRAATEVTKAVTKLDGTVRDRLGAMQQYVSSFSSKTIDACEVALQAGYIEALRQVEANERQHVASLEQARETKRQAVVEAARGAEAIDKLREKHRSRHQVEALHNEQKMLDEMATLAFARRRR